MKKLSMAFICLFFSISLLAQISKNTSSIREEKQPFKDSSLIKLSIQLYPNPSSNWVFIKHPLVTKKDAQILITDMAGNVLQKIVSKTQTSQTIINISHLQTGIYVITWMNGIETGTARLSKE
jgi:hypothetical protein